MKMSGGRGRKIWRASLAWLKRMERFVKPPVFDRSKLAPLAAKLSGAIEKIDGAELMGSRKLRLANTVAFVVRGADSIALLAGLDMEGICASSGSACSAGSLEPSHVIVALGPARTGKFAGAFFSGPRFDSGGSCSGRHSCCRKLSAAHNLENNPLFSCEWNGELCEKLSLSEFYRFLNPSILVFLSFTKPSGRLDI